MKHVFGLSTLAFLFTASLASAAVILYHQDFESPVSFVNDSGDVNIRRTVNQLYSNQPADFTFAQTNTVETLLVGGTQGGASAQGGTGGFKDPQVIAGPAHRAVPRRSINAVTSMAASTLPSVCQA